MNTENEIAAALAHEIKNPISVIKANIDCIKAVADKDMLPAFNVIDKELNKLNKLICDYTTILQPIVNKEKIFMEDIIYDVTDEFNISHGKEINFEFDLENDLYIYGDYSKISILLFNIYKNAIESGANIIETHLYNKSNAIILEIKDNGSGIDNDIIKNVGSPFFTTKEKGSGLGLLISDTIVKNHNGTLNIGSIDKGCCVKIEFNQVRKSPAS